MKNNFALLTLVFLMVFASCSVHEKKTEIPEGSTPIVYRGQIYIEGTADGHSGNFVFDTGASNFYYDSTYFSGNTYHYTNYFSALLPGAGSKPQSVEVIADTVNFRFGENLYQTKIVPILKLKPILGDFADGILGMEYFYDSVLEINYEHEYMQIFGSISEVDVSDYTKVKLKKENNRLFIPLKVQINDTITIEGDYQLDFGSGSSVTFTSSAATKYNLKDNIDKKIPYFTKYGGVGGESSSYLFRAASLQIGDFEFDKVTMSFSRDKSGALASHKHLGLLGNKIYERFHVFIDFKNNDLYLKPNSNFKKEFKFSKLGFSFVDRNETMNAWIVTGYMKGSNAVKQGLMIDDKIIAVNGVSVQDISYESQRDFFKDLTNLNLTIKRNDEVKNIQFDLEPTDKL